MTGNKVKNGAMREVLAQGVANTCSGTLPLKHLNLPFKSFTLEFPRLRNLIRSALFYCKNCILDAIYVAGYLVKILK